MQKPFVVSGRSSDGEVEIVNLRAELASIRTLADEEKSKNQPLHAEIAELKAHNDTLLRENAKLKDELVLLKDTSLRIVYNLKWDRDKNPYCLGCEIPLIYNPDVSSLPPLKCPLCKNRVHPREDNGNRLSLEVAKSRVQWHPIEER
jgi:hypothetical protein